MLFWRHIAVRLPGRASLAATLVLGALVSGIAPSARADEPALGLDTLETRVDEAPGVRAAAVAVSADVEGEGVASARTGLDYVFNNGIGPRSDIVTKNVNTNAFRYGQSVGVQLPILGRAFAQTNAVETARTTSQLARIDYQDRRRQVLTKLRTAYVLYWQYDRQQGLAQSYVDRLTQDLPAARALRSSGFFTEANLLDYLDTLSRLRTEARRDRSLERTQLAAISSALGSDIAPFHPIDPQFDPDCVPMRDDTVASAAAIDPDLAKIVADTDEVRSQLARVRGSSIDASVVANLGTVADIVPARLGYELTAGLSLTLPTHARAEERSLRNELQDELDSQQLLAEQRRDDIRAQVESVIDQLTSARDDLRQTLVADEAARENLREAEIRYRTITSPGASGFNDVQTRVVEAYSNENDAAIARADVFLKLEGVLALAPDACN
jgi:outer membrane protein TolC